MKTILVWDGMKDKGRRLKEGGNREKCLGDRLKLTSTLVRKAMKPLTE